MANSTDQQVLAAHLAAGPEAFYVDFDPTAASMHMGHLVQLLVARMLQRATAVHPGGGGALRGVDPPARRKGRRNGHDLESAVSGSVAAAAEIGGANLISDPRDINRDAKWRRLAVNQGPGGDIGASHGAWRC